MGGLLSQQGVGDGAELSFVARPNPPYLIACYTHHEELPCADDFFGYDAFCDFEEHTDDPPTITTDIELCHDGTCTKRLKEYHPARSETTIHSFQGQWQYHDEQVHAKWTDIGQGTKTTGDCKIKQSFGLRWDAGAFAGLYWLSGLGVHELAKV